MIMGLSHPQTDGHNKAISQHFRQFVNRKIKKKGLNRRENCPEFGLESAKQPKRPDCSIFELHWTSS